MKFGEQLASHLTPEWRKQYIRYEELKSILYDILLEAPLETDVDSRERYISQKDESFFAECERELTKINLFFSQKIAEAQGKYYELAAELTLFKGNFFLIFLKILIKKLLNLVKHQTLRNAVLLQSV